MSNEPSASDVAEAMSTAFSAIRAMAGRTKFDTLAFVASTLSWLATMRAIDISKTDPATIDVRPFVRSELARFAKMLKQEELIDANIEFDPSLPEEPDARAHDLVERLLEWQQSNIVEGMFLVANACAGCVGLPKAALEERLEAACKDDRATLALHLGIVLRAAGLVDGAMGNGAMRRALRRIGVDSPTADELFEAAMVIGSQAVMPGSRPPLWQDPATGRYRPDPDRVRDVLRSFYGVPRRANRVRPDGSGKAKASRRFGADAPMDLDPDRVAASGERRFPETGLSTDDAQAYAQLHRAHNEAITSFADDPAMCAALDLLIEAVPNRRAAAARWGVSYERVRSREQRAKTVLRDMISDKFPLMHYPEDEPPAESS